MPNSNDAFLEVIISWFTKRLGYLVDESRPVKLVTRTPSDIDLICMHPDPVKNKIPVKFLKKPLSRRLLIESKGWLDYPVKPGLRDDLSSLKAMKGMVIPKNYSKEDYTFVVLKEEVFEQGRKIFGTYDFDRVIVVPNMAGAAKQPQKLKEIEKLKSNYRVKGVVIIEIHEILKDLFQYIANIDEGNIENKSELTENKAQLRKDLVLGVLNLIYKYQEDIYGTVYGKNGK